jgi:hypothetical protein
LELTIKAVGHRTAPAPGERCWGCIAAGRRDGASATINNVSDDRLFLTHRDKSHAPRLVCACLESAIAIEANAAKSAPAKPQNISVSIVSVPSGCFLGAEGIARIESGAYQQLPGVVTSSLEDYISNADAQVGANREIDAGIATAADDQGIVPRSPEAGLLAELNSLTDEQLMQRAIRCGLDPSLLSSSSSTNAD